MPTTKKNMRGPRPLGEGCPGRAVLFGLLTDDLPSGRALTVRAHLRECPRCADAMEHERRFKAILDEGLASRRSSAAQESCPNEIVLCDYIDGDLEGSIRDSVARHMQRCARCRDFVSLAWGQSVESEFFPMPPQELLEAAEAIPQLERQYRQRVDDLNRLFSPRVLIHAKFNGLPTAAVRGPDEFQRHVTMITTLFAGSAQQRSAKPVRAEVLLTNERMEVVVSSARFEFTRAGVSLYRRSQRIDFGASLEDILSRHVRSGEISRHQSGIRFVSMFISRTEEFPDKVAKLPEDPVKLSDLKAVIDRLRADPDRTRLEAARMLRKYYCQITENVPHFDAREVDGFRLAPSVHDAMKWFETLGGMATR